MSQSRGSEVLYAQAPRLASLVHPILRDHHETEDVIQDAFVAWLKSGKSIGNPAAWLHSAARNNARSVLRKRKTHRNYVREVECVRTGLPDPNCPINDHPENWRGPLGRLPQRWVDLLILRYLHGFDVPTIAGLLHKTPYSTSLQLRCAKKALRRLVSKGGV